MMRVKSSCETSISKSFPFTATILPHADIHSMRSAASRRKPMSIPRSRVSDNAPPTDETAMSDRRKRLASRAATPDNGREKGVQTDAKK
jgi:hypothetical protein